MKLDSYLVQVNPIVDQLKPQQMKKLSSTAANKKSKELRLVGTNLRQSFRRGVHDLKTQKLITAGP